MRITKRRLINSIIMIILIVIALSTQKDTVPPTITKEQISENTAASASAAQTVLGTAEKDGLYHVVKVVDGDTITVEKNGMKATVRLIGIDTPEVVDPRKPVQCFGREASLKAKELLNDKFVTLESDPTQGDKDKYKRLLRFVFLEDGTNINLLMIQEGYAHEYTYKDNPYIYQLEFKLAEQKARENKKGLWADMPCPDLK